MPPTAPSSVESPVVRKGFVTVDDRLVHYRQAGTGPSLVLLHDSPRSSRLHHDTMLALAAHYRVIALDTPGYGRSAPLPMAAPTIADFAEALGRTLAVMGLADAPLYATHTSAKIALDYAARTGRPPRLILDGLSIPTSVADPAFIAAYMRPFTLDDSGAYLAREWTRLRDMLRWFPWFRPSSATRMATEARNDAWITDYAIDLLSAGPNYAGAYAAAMNYDPGPALRAVRCETIVAAREDDVLYASLDRVPVDDNGALTVVRLPADTDAWRQWLIAVAAVPSRSIPMKTGKATSTYVDLPHGQMLLHRGSERGTARPLIILEAPTILRARQWQAALADRPTIVAELPGYGDSDPLPAPSVETIVAAIAPMLSAAGHDKVDILAIGVATPIATALAARHPDRIGCVLLDGCFQLPEDHRADFADALVPTFAFDRAGAHLHRIWHMVRDGEVQWPWFDEGPTAHRTLTPFLGAETLHGVLLDILKQPTSYGDVARAVIATNADDRYPRTDRPTLVFERPGEPGYEAAQRVATTLPMARLVRRDADIAAAAAIARAFLDEVGEAPRNSHMTEAMMT